MTTARLRPVAAATVLVLCGVGGALPARAQQVKPYFLVIFDTSGSMDDDVRAPNSANSCGFGGNDPSKMDEAKCALGKIINATGDAEFGLMQFAQQTDCDGDSCSPTADSALMRVPIQTNTSGVIAGLIDNQGTEHTEELCPGGYTPLGGTLVAAKTYFEDGFGGFDPPTEGDAALACRPLAVILLTDGVECCDDCASSAPWNVGCPKANATLSAASVGTCPTACGTWGGCGSSSMGEQDAFESAPEKAYELLTESVVPSASGTVMPRAPGIQTYVIGFGITETDPRIERIAVGGGTDNPKTTAGADAPYGFYASDEASLALAFTQIIADAQPPQEVCNNLDDDCDTLIDEGIPKYCDKPGGIPGPELCDEPDETLCDGVDDDCDGLIDEGVRNECGQCEEPPEICDGIDNDCDGDVDEQLGSAACGMDEGLCEEGTLRCIAGMEQCEGEVGPKPEKCNCEDDDCDGSIDEDVDGTLCLDGRCVACMCVPYCEPAAEFMPVCDNGRRPERQPSGECLCIVDNCDTDECAAMSLERGGEAACAPDDPTLAPCRCRGGECTAPCDGVTCGSDEICNKLSGRCVQNNCRGLGCEAGQLCEPEALECVDDPCDGVACEADEACREGRCELSCAVVACARNQRCVSGRCEANPCASASCDDGEVCDERSGECVDDACAAALCARDLECLPATGECVRSRCFGVRCPEGQGCMAGQCIPGLGGVPERIDEERLIATGAGGCACRTTPPASRGTGALGAVLLALLGLWRFGRRRSGPVRGLVLFVAALAGAASTSTGCQVEPYCINCVEGEAGSAGSPIGPGGGTGAVSGSFAPGVPDGGFDAGLDAGAPSCTEPEPETCDGRDQDCDFKVDEDAEPDVNDCNQRGVCEGTVPRCLNGAFSCRYPDARETEETTCDELDNDCDGRVDETFDVGDACSVGTGACAVTGEQVCADNQTSVRCEVSQTIAPEDELCDGIDNDCDGAVDEPKSDPGSEPSYVEDALVQVSSDLWVYAYEASRPDADADDQGLITLRACSRPDAMPWTNLTYDEALEACAGADLELCGVDDWISACEGSGCGFSYVPDGGSCPADEADYPDDRSACNGHDVTALPGEPDGDALAPTGSYARCFTEHADGDIFDLSGNAKEWTTGPDSPDKNPLRGGSYNNRPGGLRCDFAFSVAAPNIRLRNVGFRCCTDTAP